MLFPLGVVNQRNISLAGLPLSATFITKSIERGYTPTNITIKNTVKTGDLPYTPIPELATFPLTEADKTDYKSDSFFTGLTSDEREYLSNYTRDIYGDNLVKEADCVAVPLFFIDDRLPSFWVDLPHTMDSVGGGIDSVYYKPVSGGKLYSAIVTQMSILNGREGPIVFDIGELIEYGISSGLFVGLFSKVNIIQEPQEFSGSMTFNFTPQTYTYTYVSNSNALDDIAKEVYQYKDVTVTAKRCTITSVSGEGSYYYNYNRGVERSFYMDKPIALSYGPLTPCTPDEFSARNLALTRQYGQWAISANAFGKNILTVGDHTATVDTLYWSTNLHRHAIAFPASYGITSVTSTNPNVQIRKRQFSIAAGNGGQRLMDEWLISFPSALSTSITFSK